MKQIKERGYFEKYLKLNKTKVMVGVAFDEKTRNIDKWLMEEVGS